MYDFQWFFLSKAKSASANLLVFRLPDLTLQAVLSSVHLYTSSLSTRFSATKFPDSEKSARHHYSVCCLTVQNERQF
jgi:hypothetical protein